MPIARWTSCTPPPFNTYALLGLPDGEFTSLTRMGEGGTQIGCMTTLMLVGVEALAMPPTDRIVSAIPRFAGHLNEGRQLESVCGLSGGPILGVSKNRQTWDHACVAVQGSWDERRRIIYGTPISIVVEALVPLLQPP
jgi:hypothetical protein